MVETLTKHRIAKHRLFLNVIFLLLSLCIVNISLAAEDFPWELFYPAFIKKSIDKDQGYIHLDNGMLKVGLDLLSGGAIYYLSRSNENRNLVNIHDRGRYIQQSYYAGNLINRQNEGQSIYWSPWNWNPIQVGDAFGNSSEVVESDIENGVVYTKTLPLLWDMNNERAECFFEQWTTLYGNTVHVRNKLTIFRTDSLWDEGIPLHQELPAVYTIGDLHNLYTYTGLNPWHEEPLTKIINNGPPWEYWSNPEGWAAHVDSNMWGVGVYNKNATLFVGGFHDTIGGDSNDNSTGYISPLDTVILGKTDIYEYEYDLIVGTLTQIRQFAYTNIPEGIDP